MANAVAFPTQYPTGLPQFDSFLNNSLGLAGSINTLALNRNQPAAITGGGTTYTAAQVLAGSVSRTLTGPTTDVTPTVAQMATLITQTVPQLTPLQLNGLVFDFILQNTAAFALTLTVDASWTTANSPLPTGTVVATSWKRFWLTFVVTGTNASPTFTNSSWNAVMAGPNQ